MLRHIPNILTILRIIAIIPIAWCFYISSYQLALYLLLLAGISDAVDGYLARRYQWSSYIGSILDPLADKLLIISLFLVFGAREHLPWLLVWIILGRDLIIVLGALAYRYLFGSIEIRPLLISKLNTFLQLLLLTMTLIHVALEPLPTDSMQLVQATVMLSTILSGMAYIWLWGKLALTKRKQLRE